MELLIDGARRHGLRRLAGNIFSVNVPMRTVATALGFELHVDPDDARHIIATLDLHPDSLTPPQVC